MSHPQSNCLNLDATSPGPSLSPSPPSPPSLCVNMASATHDESILHSVVPIMFDVSFITETANCCRTDSTTYCGEWAARLNSLKLQQEDVAQPLRQLDRLCAGLCTKHNTCFETLVEVLDSVETFLKSASASLRAAVDVLETCRACAGKGRDRFKEGNQVDTSQDSFVGGSHESVSGVGKPRVPPFDFASPESVSGVGKQCIPPFDFANPESVPENGNECSPHDPAEHLPHLNNPDTEPVFGPKPLASESMDTSTWPHLRGLVDESARQACTGSTNQGLDAVPPKLDGTPPNHLANITDPFTVKNAAPSNSQDTGASAAYSATPESEPVHLSKPTKPYYALDFVESAAACGSAQCPKSGRTISFSKYSCRYKRARKDI